MDHRDLAAAVTVDDLSVRLSVKLGFSLTLGIYNGPVTKSVIAEHIERMIEENGVEEFIDTIDLRDLTLDDGTEMVQSVGG